MSLGGQGSLVSQHIKEIQSMQMSQQDIDLVKKEIEDFKAKATQYATSSPALSAHYHRLYMASKGSLKSFDRIRRSLENKAYLEERRRLKKGGNQAAPHTSKSKSA
jgi:hypothetical protein